MRSVKEKEIQELECERALGVLGLPALRERKHKDEEEDSDDSTGTVQYSPPKSVVRRSESVQLPKTKRKRKALQRAASLPLNHQLGMLNHQLGVKVNLLGMLPLPRMGGGIVKKRGKKTSVKKNLGCRVTGGDSCDC